MGGGRRGAAWSSSEALAQRYGAIIMHVSNHPCPLSIVDEFQVSPTGMTGVRLFVSELGVL